MSWSPANQRAVVVDALPRAARRGGPALALGRHRAGELAGGHLRHRRGHVDEHPVKEIDARQRWPAPRGPPGSRPRRWRHVGIVADQRERPGADRRSLQARCGIAVVRERDVARGIDPPNANSPGIGTAIGERIAPELHGFSSGVGGSALSQNVTGPSLTRCTFMSAPKIPVSTGGCSRRAHRDEAVEQAAAVLRRRRRGEAGAGAAARVGGERELRHQQQAGLPGACAASSAERAVHPARLVREHAIGSSRSRSRRAWRSVSPRSAHTSTDQAAPDRADHAPSTTTGPSRDPLQQRDHRRAGRARRRRPRRRADAPSALRPTVTRANAPLADLHDVGAGRELQPLVRDARRRRSARRPARCCASPRRSTTPGPACFSSCAIASGAPAEAHLGNVVGHRALAEARLEVGAAPARPRRREWKRVDDLLRQHHLRVARIAPRRRTRPCSRSISAIGRNDSSVK